MFTFYTILIPALSAVVYFDVRQKRREYLHAIKIHKS